MEKNCVETDVNERSGGKEEAVEEEDEEMLKKRISGHPLYGLLIDRHLSCLKVGFGDIGEVGVTTAFNQGDTNLINSTISRSADLDNFMEVYCKALGKLKEAMEKPVQETTTFISAMYVQLSELSVNSEPQLTSSVDSSDELDSIY